MKSFQLLAPKILSIALGSLLTVLPTLLVGACLRDLPSAAGVLVTSFVFLPLSADYHRSGQHLSYPQ